MGEITICPELLTDLAGLSSSSRSSILKKLTAQEWPRCAEDIHYWLSPSAHGGVPYVFTKDEHAGFECVHCPPSSENNHAFYHLAHHLSHRHGVESDNTTIEGQRIVKAHFRQLPAIRPFPYDEPSMSYIKPIINTWLTQQLILVEKSRDMMATWMFIVMYTWDTIFHSGRQNFFQAQNAKKTYDLVRRAHHILKQQPSFFTPYPYTCKVGAWGGGELQIDTLDSEIIGMPEGNDQIRQYHPSGMFTDETAFHKNAEETFAAVKPAIQAGGRYTGVSTAYPAWFMHACKDTLDASILD